MKAVVMEGPKLPLEVRDMPVPGVGPRDVLIKVMACGVSRSDWHIWQGDWAWIGLKPPMPAILRHEQAGIVEQVGADVRLIKPGMRVLTPFHNGCGACRFCNSGDSNLCERAGPAHGRIRAVRRHRWRRFQRGPAARRGVVRGRRGNGLPLHDGLSRRGRPRRRPLAGGRSVGRQRTQCIVGRHELLAF